MHQFVSADKRIRSVRTAIALLLAIYLSPTAMQLHWALGMQPFPTGHGVLLISAPAVYAASVFDIDRRHKPRAPDGSFNNALLQKQIAGNYSGKSAPFSTDDGTVFNHRAARTPIPIRAPPIHYRIIA